MLKLRDQMSRTCGKRQYSLRHTHDATNIVARCHSAHLKKPMNPVVLLYDYNGLGLILAVPSGVRYRNQAAGHACWKFEIEGVLVPIPLPQDRAPLRALEDHFDSGWESLKEQDADAIDRILASADCDFLKVDRGRLHESYEAWVHVTIAAGDPKRHPELFVGLTVDRGVLTWENSD